MNTKHITLAITLLALASYWAVADHFGTAFTYQGQLLSGGQTANGLYDFQFKIFDSPTGSTGQLGPTFASNAVAVANGLFTLPLDFGDGIFTGPPRWLDIGVKTNGAVTLTSLAPRQPLTPSPYALYTPNADVALSAAVASSVANNAVTAPGIAAGNVVKSLNTLRDDVTLAAGTNVTLTPSGQTLTLASPTDWHVGGNGGTATGVNFLGTTDLQPLELRVNNQRALLMDTNGNLSAGTTSSIHLGGGTWGATVSGGFANAIQAGSILSTIAGGQQNTIQSGGWTCTIGGGGVNTIKSNSYFATIPGGYFNTVAGSYSFAAGNHASATNNGAFVWADSQAGDFGSTAINQFLIRAGSGVGVNKNNPATALDVNGTVTATSFNGSGAGLTGIAQLANGTAVRSLNGLTDIVTLAGGTNVSVTPSGNTLRLDGPVYTAGNGLALTSLQFSLRPGSTITNDNVMPYAFRAVSTAGYWGNSVGLSGESGGAAQASPGSPCGVWGESWAGRGVMGASRSTNWYDGGVHGWGIGVANGVLGVTDTGIGVRGRSENGGIGVYGESANGGFAAKFNGAVTVVGVTPNLNVDGAIVVDGSDLNAGTLVPGLTFGAGSGEGIASKRTSGANQYGLDFYAGFNRRLSIGQSGAISVFENTIFLRPLGDANHGVGYYGASKLFAGTAPDGPVLFGYTGGALGTEQWGTEKIALTWNASGYVGVGTTNPPAVPLDVRGANYIGSTADGLLNIGPATGSHLTLDADDLQARTASSTTTLYLNYYGGNVSVAQGQLFALYGSGVGIGTSSLSGYKLYVAGSAYCTGSWSGSDARWKKNVQPVTGALEKIAQLQGVTYDWRRDEFPDRNFDTGSQLGFLAQEVEKVVPEAVHTDAEGYKAVAYDKLTAVLTEGVKEQQTEIKGQKAEIAELKARNAELEKNVAELQALVQRLAAKVNGGVQ